MKLPHLLLILVLTSCATLKQPSEQQTEQLLTQVLKDVATEEKFKDVDPFRLVEDTFTQSLNGVTNYFDNEYLFNHSEKFFSNLKHFNIEVEEAFNMPENVSYYREQTKIDNALLLKVKNNKVRAKDEPRLQNSLQISRPFFSPKKDVAMILVASSKYGGGQIKVYRLINKKWKEECFFYPFYY